MDKRDNLEAKVNAICDLLALSFMINEEVEMKSAAVRVQNFEKASGHRENENALRKQYDILLAQFPLPISTTNDAVSDTTKVESSNAAGNQNSPSWKEILEKEVTDVYPQDKFGDYAALAKSAFEKGMNRAKDYYEKEVVEPLKEELKVRKYNDDDIRIVADRFMQIGLGLMQLNPGKERDKCFNDELNKFLK